MNREKKLALAKKVAKTKIMEKGVESIIIWGSMAESDTINEDNCDIDLLVIIKKIPLTQSKSSNVLFGLKTKTFVEENIKFDVFYIDKPYILKALEQGHWTIFRAIESGLILYDSGVFVDLRHNLSEFRAFSITKPKEWRNQAFNLIEKSQVLIEQEESIAGIILARHAADAMVQAFLYKKLGKPTSPKSFLIDLKQNVPDDSIYQLYIRIHGLNNVRYVSSMETNLLSFDFLKTLDSLINK